MDDGQEGDQWCKATQEDNPEAEKTGKTSPKASSEDGTPLEADREERTTPEARLMAGEPVEPGTIIFDSSIIFDWSLLSRSTQQE